MDLSQAESGALVPLGAKCAETGTHTRKSRVERFSPFFSQDDWESLSRARTLLMAARSLARSLALPWEMERALTFGHRSRERGSIDIPFKFRSNSVQIPLQFRSNSVRQRALCARVVAVRLLVRSTSSRYLRFFLFFSFCATYLDRIVSDLGNGR